MNEYRTNDWSRPRENAQDATRPPAAPLSQPIARPRISRHGSGSRHSSSSSRRKLKWAKRVAGLSLASLVAVIMTTVAVYSKMTQYRESTQRLTLDLRQAEGDLARAQEKITEMNDDLRILLANRIPGISELVMNRQIEVNNQYVRNVTFVQSGIGDTKTIEFSTVLQNTRPDPILPKVDIVLFDEFGLQTGTVRLDKKQTVTPVDFAEMQPGETRTYSGQIRLQRQTPSKYFVFQVE